MTATKTRTSSKKSENTVQKIEYIYTPTAYEFIQDWEHEVLILGGAMNLGKGAASAVKLFTYIFQRAPIVDGYRTSTFFGIRNDYASFRESTLNEIYKWFPPGCVKPSKGEVNSQTTEIKIHVPKSDKNYGIDAKIIMVSMKNFNIDDYRSYNVTGLQWSEMQECPDEKIFSALLDRTGRYPYRDMPKMAFGDINYPDDIHWLYNRFVTDKEHTENVLNWKLLRMPPVIMLDKDRKYVENPDAEIPSHDRKYDYWWSIVNRGDDSEIKRSVIGDFSIIAQGIPVYPEFNDSMIVRTKPIRGKTLLFGIDPGNRGHLAIVIGQLTIKGKLRILGSLSPESYMDFSTFVTDMLNPYIMSEIYPFMCDEGEKIQTFGWRDPTDAEDKHTNKNTGDIIKELTGINTVKCSTNDVFLRTNSVTERIRRNMLEVDERASSLVKALKGGYHIAKNGKPDKGHWSHVGNALEYLCYGVANHTGAFGEDSDQTLVPLMS